MKYITLFWEVLLFIPTIFLSFFINYDKLFFHFSFLKIFNFFNLPYLNQIKFLILIWIFLVLNELIWGAIKYFFFKERPNPMKYKNAYEKILAGSFPSLHSSRTFLLFLFSLFFTENIFIKIGFFIFWLIISYSRIHLKKHFIEDIIWWIALSCFVFLILYNGLGFIY